MIFKLSAKLKKALKKFEVNVPVVITRAKFISALDEYYGKDNYEIKKESDGNISVSPK